MADYDIFFPSPDASCHTYEHGWTSACLDSSGITRGFTQEWYWEASLSTWINATESSIVYPVGDSGDLVFLDPDGGFSASAKLNFKDNKFSIEGNVAKKYKSHLNVVASTASPGVTEDISFSDSDVHYVTFSGQDGVVNLNIINPPSSDYYAELTLIVNDGGAPASLNIRGNGGASTVKMDVSSPAIEDTLQDDKLYMWKIWTIDGGSNYYVYRANGFGRYWSP